MFEVEKSLTEWRKRMVAAGIKTPVPLEELEIHLREDLDREMLDGLSAEMAFEKAARRIGLAREISSEFDKVSKQQWSTRALWIWLWIGSFGLAVAVIMNLVGRFLVHGSSSQNLFPQWRIVWSPSYVVLISLALIGSVIGVARLKYDGMKRSRWIGVAAGTSFIWSYLLPAAGGEPGVSCFVECWRVLVHSDRYQNVSVGWWSYYSGFVVCNALFVMFLGAFFFEAPLIRVRRCLLLALSLHVLSWLIVNHLSIWSMQLGIGYYVWLLSFALLLSAHFVTDNTLNYSNSLMPEEVVSP